MPHQSDPAQGVLDVKRLAAAVLLLTIAGSAALAQDALTLKERLSDKASDGQRVDNCHVLLERRGTKPRPDCPEESRSQIPPGETGSPAPAGAR